MKKHHNLVDVDCVVELDHPDRRSLAVWDGVSYTEDCDPFTGERRRMRLWTWLPKSLVEVNDDGTVTMPQWLAEEKGLV